MKEALIKFGLTAATVLVVLYIVKKVPFLKNLFM